MSGAPAVADTQARLRTGLERFIASRSGSPVAVEVPARLPGGTGRDAWVLDADIATGQLAGRHSLIYLRDRGGASLGSRLPRAEELRVLAMMRAAGVRVPRPYWHVPAADPTGIGPGQLLERVEGEVVARPLLEGPAFAAVRPRLLEQIGAELAGIHAVETGALPDLPRPAPGRTAAEQQIAELEAELGAVDEPYPTLELGLRWLRAQPPGAERSVVVHGDYRLGNLVVDPARGLRAVLDWELAHVGDPGEDLGWFCMRFWRALDRPEGPGLGPRERLLAAYAAGGGAVVDSGWLRYWELLANIRWAIVTLTQARRHLSGQERSLELASIGRRCAEVEWEVLRLLGEA